MISEIQNALVASGLDVVDVFLEDSTNECTDDFAKTPGVKQVSLIRATLADGTTRKFVLKRIGEDGVRGSRGRGRDQPLPIGAIHAQRDPSLAV